MPFLLPVCYLISGPIQSTRSLLTAVQSSGAELCGDEAIEMLRVESGSPQFGIDISEANLPQEIGEMRWRSVSERLLSLGRRRLRDWMQWARESEINGSDAAGL